MTNLWINDLRVAASFVRSIHTDDHELNYELQILADRIDVLIDETSPRGVMPIASKGSVGKADKS
jgi:hypothetical protein